MKNNLLESIIREKLEDLSIEPSERTKNLIYQKIKKRGRIILYRRLSIAAGIILFMTVGLFYLIPGTEKERVADQRGFPAVDQGSDLRQDTSGNQETPLSMETDAGVAQHEGKDRKQAEYDDVNHNGMVTANPQSAKRMEKKEPTLLANVPEAVKENKGAADSFQMTSIGDPISPEFPAGQKLNREPPEDQNLLSDGSVDDTTETTGPQKITIEYIASGSKRKRSGGSRSQIGEFYSKMNKLVYPDEVLSDIRSLKDQLFALEFISRKSIQTQNNKEK